MTRRSKLIRVLMVLLSAVLIVSMLQVNTGEVEAQAPKVAHEFYSVSYEKVYANPNVNKEEAAFIYALAILHPALGKVKHLKKALTYVGLWRAFVAIMQRENNTKKAQGYYILEKVTYKAKKPTSSYWGYSQTYIYSSALRVKEKGSVLVIGKTGY